MEGSKGVSPRQSATFMVALWHNPTVAAPPRLLNELDRRGVSVQEVTNPFMALALICSEARRSGGEARSALVMVDPESLPDAADVYDAVMRHARGSRCWLYSAGSNPPLRAVVEADVERWRPAAEPSVVVRSVARPAAKAQSSAPPAPAYRTKSAQPSLRITGDAPIEQARKPADLEPEGFADPADTLRPSQVLTQEELRMLLGEEDPGQA